LLSLYSFISLNSRSSKVGAALWKRHFFSIQTRTWMILKDVGDPAFVLSRQNEQLADNGLSCG
jgi:hypothetical protein